MTIRTQSHATTRRAFNGSLKQSFNIWSTKSRRELSSQDFTGIHYPADIPKLAFVGHTISSKNFATICDLSISRVQSSCFPQICLLQLPECGPDLSERNPISGSFSHATSTLSSPTFTVPMISKLHVIPFHLTKTDRGIQKNYRTTLSPNPHGHSQRCRFPQLRFEDIARE
jgi:hypothetical protein